MKTFTDTEKAFKWWLATFNHPCYQRLRKESRSLLGGDYTRGSGVSQKRMREIMSEFEALRYKGTLQCHRSHRVSQYPRYRMEVSAIRTYPRNETR